MATTVSRIRNFCVTLTVALVVTGCAAGAKKGAASGAPSAEGPPEVVAFFRDAPIRGARLSPSGEKIAFLTTLDGAAIIGVLDVATFDRHPILRFPHADMQLAWLEWVSDERLVFSADVPLSWSRGVRARSRLLFGIDPDGQELTHLGARWFGRSGKRSGPDWEEIHQVPIQFEDDVVAWLPDDPQHILVAISPPDERSSTGVYRVDVDIGDLDQVVRPQSSIREWYADPEGQVRMGFVATSNRLEVWGRTSPDAPFRELTHSTAGNPMEFSPLGISAKPGMAYVASSKETGRASIYEYDLVRGRKGRRVFSHPEVDVGGLIYSRHRRQYVGAHYTTDRSQATYWHEGARAEKAAIDRALPGRTNWITSRSLDGRVALVSSSSDTLPPTVYLYDRDERRLEELYSSHPALEKRQLAPMRRVTYQARDGLTIPAYLTIPLGVAPKNLPVVAYPHGGPWSRDAIGFDSVVQFLASQGYAVFQPNFRGSTGYGIRFKELGYERLGEEMQDDLTDGVEWLIEQGIADRDRIAIYGASYGGYAAIMGAVKTPDLYQCAASYAGLMDIDSFMGDLDWYNADKMNAHAFGRDSARRKRNSPVNHAASIQIPILLGHGEDDPTVHHSQSRAMASALESHDKDVELVMYDDEIHGKRGEANRIDWWSRMSVFLGDCLSKKTASATPSSPARG